VAALKAENAAQKQRIAELERRLGLTSSNNGKPTSSDGLKKREPSDRKARAVPERLQFRTKEYFVFELYVYPCGQLAGSLCRPTRQRPNRD
jgi:hypothetical protein